MGGRGKLAALFLVGAALLVGGGVGGYFIAPDEAAPSPSDRKSVV